MSEDLSDQPAELSLDDICEKCGMSADAVTAYIEQGLIEVEGDLENWRFTQHSVIRLRTAYRVEKDLSLNPAGATLALELMAQIEDLKRQLRRFSED